MEKAVRKKIRLSNYDYSSGGSYFITICTDRKYPYLSEIKCVGDGVLDVPHIELTEFGIMVNEQIKEMNAVYDRSKIIKYVIMPDHVHMIICLYENIGSNTDHRGTSGTPSPTNAAVPALVSTLKRFINKKIGFNIWQRSFHDHIIRSEKEFLEIWQYIENNPINWANDKFNQNLWR